MLHTEMMDQFCEMCTQHKQKGCEQRVTFWMLKHVVHKESLGSKC
jgi:hypothetical protein